MSRPSGNCLANSCLLSSQARNNVSMSSVIIIVSSPSIWYAGLFPAVTVLSPPASPRDAAVRLPAACLRAALLAVTANGEDYHAQLEWRRLDVRCRPDPRLDFQQPKQRLDALHLQRGGLVLPARRNLVGLRAQQERVRNGACLTQSSRALRVVLRIRQRAPAYGLSLSLAQRILRPERGDPGLGVESARVLGGLVSGIDCVGGDCGVHQSSPPPSRPSFFLLAASLSLSAASANFLHAQPSASQASLMPCCSIKCPQVHFTDSGSMISCSISEASNVSESHSPENDSTSASASTSATRPNGTSKRRLSASASARFMAHCARSIRVCSFALSTPIPDV